MILLFRPPFLGWFLAVLFLAACQAELEGISQTQDGSGPLVLFDLDAKPLPEIPFPNDLATRPDPGSATGRRVNASQVAPTALESGIREKIDRLDGFGTLQPISVAFDKPLDIADLLSRHRDNLDFADDAVYLFSLDPEGTAYDQPVLLDIGRGNFPLTLRNSNAYFASDPRVQVNNLLFDTEEEDLNRNQKLDPGEDTDDDGVLDHPNLWPEGSDPKDGLMTFYESETNTLILRPVVPLRERTTYAVVLTKRLRGREGEPVRSPFKWVHHLDQAEELQRLGKVFDDWQRQGISLGVEDVAFAWVFTTQSVTADLVAVREGLYGYGPLGWLARKFPVGVAPDRAKDRSEDPPYYILERERLVKLIEALGPGIFGDYMTLAEPVMASFDNVDYFVSGSFESPDFIRTETEDFDHQNFSVDLQQGTAAVERGRIRFVMAIPKETERYHPPFPVVVYCHSFTSFRLEALGFSGFMAGYGLASVGIDAWGHGMPLDAGLVDLILTAASSYGFEPFAQAMLEGRARDFTGDGVPESGGNYWTAYGFHTRDVVRQGVADHLQLIRVLRSFDGERTWELDQDGDDRWDFSGDFNGDGRVDAGGPNVDYFAWGQSMGGIHSAILAPLEPSVVAAAPTAGGGGLCDVGVRTMLGGVRRAVMLRTMGPLVVGEPTAEGAIRVRLLVPLANEERELPVGVVPGVAVGDQVVVENLGTPLVPKRIQHLATVHPGLKFRVSMEADTGDRFQLWFLREGKETARLTHWNQDVWYLDNQEEDPIYRKGEELRTPTEGYGMARCTPDLRRMVGLFQMIMEPADPASFARHYFLSPLKIRPEGKRITNLLEVATLGDQEVPIQTQVTIARAAGVIPHLEVASRYGMPVNDWLIANYVYEGLAGVGRFPGDDAVFDPDDLDEGRDGFGAPEPEPGKRLRMSVEYPEGVSGIRFAYMHPNGQHGVFPTNPDPQFDIFTYFANLIARYFATRGTEILDDTCLENSSCPLP